MTDEDLYRQLQRHLDRMPVPFPATESGVEIRILKQLFSPEDARVALALSMIGEPAAVIHRRLRRDTSLDDLRKRLDDMAGRGLILRWGRGRRGPRYSKMPFVVGFYEAQVNRLTPTFERDVLAYRDEAFGTAFHSGKTPQMRTVPVNRRLPTPGRPVARYNDIIEYARSHAGPFAVMNCICKQGQDVLSEPCRATSEREHCVTFGAAASIVVDRQMGRYAQREEIIRILERADRDGLVLQPENTRNPLFVCCCCGCCCGVLKTAKAFPRPAEVLSSDYHAEADQAQCQQCAACVGRCQMEAVSADAGPAVVDGARCIGCGLCVSTCPSGAMRLVPNERTTVPPARTMNLYAQMFRQRYGSLRFVAAVGRNMLGLKT